MFAKRFFYVCAGLFLLVAAYAMGVINRKAGAQAGATIVGYSTGGPSAQHHYVCRAISRTIGAIDACGTNAIA